jgi:hypothetical protein
LNSTTADWAYVITGDFPYSNWMAWYLYSTKGVPLYKFSDTDIKPAPGSTNPTVNGNPVLATPRHYSITFMPATTPASVVSSMQSQGQNVALLPEVGSSPGVSIVSRSYWSFANDGLGNYDRFGYGGPTNTPYPTITAFETDASTGALTTTPVPNCGAQSQLPQKAWYNHQTQKPIVTFANSSPPGGLDSTRVPYPVQVIWGADDPILRLRRFGWQALAATGLETLHAFPARHFLHEDQAAAVAGLVAELAGRGSAAH